MLVATSSARTTYSKDHERFEDEFSPCACFQKQVLNIWIYKYTRSKESQRRRRHTNLSFWHRMHLH